MTDILTLARENGFSHIGFADMSALEPLEEVRKMCSADRCGKWNANWSCPPACGSIEYAKRRQSAQARIFEFCQAGEDAASRLPSAHGRLVHDMRTVHISGQAVPIPVKTPVVNGGFRPFCKRCMRPIGAWI